MSTRELVESIESGLDRQRMNPEKSEKLEELESYFEESDISAGKYLEQYEEEVGSLYGCIEHAELHSDLKDGDMSGILDTLPGNY